MGRIGVILFAVMTISGCTAGLQDCYYEHSQKKRTWCAWMDYRKCTPDCIDDIDYQCGWRAGYYDVLMGNSGCPPLVPPKKYWRPCQVSYHCDENRHQWYIGFQDGASCAKQQPDTHYIKLWMPPPVCPCPTGCPTGCPTDGPVSYPAASPIPADEYLPPVAPALSGSDGPTPAIAEPLLEDVEEAIDAPAVDSTPSNSTPPSVPMPEAAETGGQSNGGIELQSFESDTTDTDEVEIFVPADPSRLSREQAQRQSLRSKSATNQSLYGRWDTYRSHTQGESTTNRTASESFPWSFGLSSEITTDDSVIRSPKAYQEVSQR